MDELIWNADEGTYFKAKSYADGLRDGRDEGYIEGHAAGEKEAFERSERAAAKLGSVVLIQAIRALSEEE